MTCSYVKMPGGGMAFVKHSAPRYPKCKFCEDRLSRSPVRALIPAGCLVNRAKLLCDFVVGKTLGGSDITCDMPVCERCAARVGDKDFCPKHDVKSGAPEGGRIK